MSRGDGDLELLAAYVDGVTELAPDERRRLEARLVADPAARDEHAAVRAVIERLRAPEAAASTEPDWAALEHSIREAVGADLPRSWWQRWRWIAPTATFACAMAVALAIWPRRAPSPSAPTLRPSTEQVAPRPATDAARIGGEVVPLWLDGAELDVDLSLVPSGLLAEPAPGPGGADAAGFEEASPPDERGLLPATDLAWVDGLDDEALARAERWLAEHKT